MKRLILILLCFPLFLFSQEEEKYEKTISISQFVDGLKNVIKLGKDYYLENTLIKYNPYTDKKIDWEGGAQESDMIFQIGDIHSKTTNVILNKCVFSNKMFFYNCTLNNWSLYNCQIEELYFDISINHLFFKNVIGRSLRLGGSDYISKDVTITSCKIESIDIARGNLANFNLNRSEIGYLFIHRNIFTPRLQEGGQWGFWDSTSVLISLPFIVMWNNSIEKVRLSDNIFNHSTDSLLLSDSIDRERMANGVSEWAYQLSPFKNSPFSKIPWQKLYDSIPIYYLNNYSKIKHKYIIDDIIIDECKIKKLFINGKNTDSLKFITEVNTDPHLYSANRIKIGNSSITEDFSMKIKIDSFFFYQNNELPVAVNKIKISWYDLPGFIVTTIPIFIDHPDNYYIGHSGIPLKIPSQLSINQSNDNNYNQLVENYMQLITIWKTKGDNNSKNACLQKLKNIETNRKKASYLHNKTTSNWFIWKGSEFIKYYCEYGMNPFKALNYCVWTMLFFAMFYFIFYNDWDKIDRGFLIEKFNSVMDYFTTEKRIEDFYSATHDQEMTTFTDFKDTLDKNKVYMPGMLASLAKPIYQISLLRYKLLSFSYKKAEFMAGRKWVDLEKKDRYWIGTLTFFLTLTYIIYLVFIRALNSIVLSINAFSTLGFGQIPVRGFTKYVAVIEGFIGWFLLSVFIVSLLSQMMSV